ncbi:MAG: lysoplasmalogenase family protein, partial [Candidatus Heimdallarchaeota archaeon]
MGIGTLITFIFYLISLGILVVHLNNGKKNHFLLSVVFIVFGSINYNLLVVSDYKYVIFLFALLFSFLGDLFMANKIKIVESRIINGILGFGIAHILYIIAFYRLGEKKLLYWQVLLGIFAFLIIYRIAVYTPSLSRILLVGT